MRRMITDKQQAYIKSIGQAVQPIALYPSGIDAETTELDWNEVKNAIEPEKIDLENHVIHSNTNFFFNFPELFAQYGIGDGGTTGYVSLTADGDINIPQNVTNFEELKAWICTQEFIDVFTFGISESMMGNDNINYYAEEVELDIYNGLLRCSASFTTDDDTKGTPVIEATDPQYNGIKAETIQTSKIQAPNALQLEGSGTRPYVEIINDKVLFNNLPIYAGFIKVAVTDGNNNFEAYTPVDYIVGKSNFLQYSGGIGIMLHGTNSLTTQTTGAINAAAPTKLRLKASKIGVVPNVYGITNTKIILDKNIYIWDSNDKNYVLQGTFQSISAPNSITIVLNEPSMPVKLYNTL